MTGTNENLERLHLVGLVVGAGGGRIICIVMSVPKIRIEGWVM